MRRVRAEEDDDDQQLLLLGLGREFAIDSELG